MADALYILFKDFLKFTTYPGTPFTGNPIQDVLQFFFLPTVLIIFFIYILLGRIGLGHHAMMRTLMGVAIFVFMIINGWFAAFAGSTAFYFVILILLGVVYFVMGHFQHHGGNPGPQAPGHFPRIKRRDEYGNNYGMPREVKSYTNPLTAKFSLERRNRLAELEEDIRMLNARVREARSAGSKDEANTLQTELRELEKERRDLLHQGELFRKVA